MLPCIAIGNFCPECILPWELSPSENLITDPKRVYINARFQEATALHFGHRRLVMLRLLTGVLNSFALSTVDSGRLVWQTSMPSRVQLQPRLL
jgi:hypothetical protein